MDRGGWGGNRENEREGRIERKSWRGRRRRERGEVGGGMREGGSTKRRGRGDKKQHTLLSIPVMAQVESDHTHHT